MNLKEFEVEMINAPCCNNKTILAAIEASSPTDEELLDHMAFVMTDESFSDERIFFLPLVSRIYKTLQEKKNIV